MDPVFVLDISIHRSLAGPDALYLLQQDMLYDFNPQVPCGTRPTVSPSTACSGLFQSTGPLRDPTQGNFFRFREGDISIHRSLAGPDDHPRSLRSRAFYFNPQVPCGTRRPQAAYLRPQNFISIHRSLAGPDDCTLIQNSSCGIFQSTGPLRDPTSKIFIFIFAQNISIHRSLAGPDPLHATDPLD